MLLTFEQSLAIAHERYQTLLTEVSRERMVRQGRTTSIRDTTRPARRLLDRLSSRLFHIGWSNHAHTASSR